MVKVNTAHLEIISRSCEVIAHATTNHPQPATIHGERAAETGTGGCACSGWGVHFPTLNVNDCVRSDKSGSVVKIVRALPGL